MSAMAVRPVISGAAEGFCGDEFIHLGFEIEDALGGRVVFGEGESVQVGEGGGGGSRVDDSEKGKVPIPKLRKFRRVARRRIGERVAERWRESERDLFDAVGRDVDFDPTGADLLGQADAIAANPQDFTFLAFAILIENNVGAGGRCEGEREGGGDEERGAADHGSAVVGTAGISRRTSRYSGVSFRCECSRNSWRVLVASSVRPRASNPRALAA